MEDTSFSFLSAQPEEQEEFLQRIKEYAQNVNASVPGMADGDFVENMFSFVPLVETGEKQILTSSAIPQLISQPIGADSNTRQWKLIHLSPLLAARNSINVNGVVTSPAALTVQQIMDEVRVEIRTRSEKPSQMMPERLYSSLKYELKQQVSLGFSDSQVLMAKIQVVNPADPTEEMVKNNGQGLIKGIQDMCVLSKTNNTYEAKFKIQFTDVSYHFENKHFALKVSYFDPSINIQEPMLIVVSSPFKVFARRPSKKVEKKEKTASPTTTTTKTKTTPKRKAASTEEAAAPKKQKTSSPKSPITSASSSPVLSSPSPVSSPLPPALNSTIELRKSVSMKDFMDCLELLSAFKNALPKEELATALRLAQQKLFGNDDFESKFLAP